MIIFLSFVQHLLCCFQEGVSQLQESQRGSQRHVAVSLAFLAATPGRHPRQAARQGGAGPPEALTFRR